MKRFIIVIFITGLLLGTSCQRRANRYFGGPSSTREYDRQSSSRISRSQNAPVQPSEQPQNNSAGSRTVLSGKEIFQRYSPAVFMVYTSTGKQTFQGSGFFVSSDGLAVSNYHVFEGTTIGAEVIVLSDGTQLKLSEIIVRDEKYDLMVFRVASSRRDFTYIPISRREVQVGEKVFAIGSPKGLENTFSSGEISQLRGDNLIQINVPIDHGSSGGALINEYGEVIGVTSSGDETSGANLNFAESIEPVLKYIHR